MSINIKSARERAEEYYCTEEYSQKVHALGDVVSAQQDTLKDLHIALDLEGVLVNNPFPRETGISLTNRLRRPLAQELVDLLNEFAGRLTIWTAAYEGLPEEMIQSSGLVLPEEVDLVDRTKYIHSMIFKYPEITDQIYSFEIADTGFPPDTQEDIKRMILNCGVKIAKVCSVDHIFDDQSERHKVACKILGYDEDAEKLVHVPKFSLIGSGLVARHHKDEGLLRTMEKFAG